MKRTAGCAGREPRAQRADAAGADDRESYGFAFDDGLLTRICMRGWWISSG